MNYTITLNLTPDLMTPFHSKFTIDTGCENSTISKNIIQILNINQDKTIHVKYNVLNGFIISDSYLIKFSLKIDEEIIFMANHFCVIDDKNRIGLDLLQHFNFFIIDNKFKLLSVRKDIKEFKPIDNLDNYTEKYILTNNKTNELFKTNNVQEMYGKLKEENWILKENKPFDISVVYNVVNNNFMIINIDDDETIFFKTIFCGFEIDFKLDTGAFVTCADFSKFENNWKKEHTADSIYLTSAHAITKQHNLYKCDFFICGQEFKNIICADFENKYLIGSNLIKEMKIYLNNFKLDYLTISHSNLDDFLLNEKKKRKENESLFLLKDNEVKKQKIEK